MGSKLMQRVRSTAAGCRLLQATMAHIQQPARAASLHAGTDADDTRSKGGAQLHRVHTTRLCTPGVFSTAVSTVPVSGRGPSGGPAAAAATHSNDEHTYISIRILYTAAPPASYPLLQQHRIREFPISSFYMHGLMHEGTGKIAACQVCRRPWPPGCRQGTQLMQTHWGTGNDDAAQPLQQSHAAATESERAKSGTGQERACNRLARLEIDVACQKAHKQGREAWE